MKTTAILASAVLAMSLIVGCDDKKDSTPAVDKSAADSVQKKVDNAMAPIQGTASDMTTKAKEEAGKMADSAKEQTGALSDSAKSAVADASAEATKLLEQVQGYIKDHKWELADTTLTKLEGMKASLPATITDQLPTLRKAIDAGKAMKMPGM